MLVDEVEGLEVKEGNVGASMSQIADTTKDTAINGVLILTMREAERITPYLSLMKLLSMVSMLVAKLPILSEHKMVTTTSFSMPVIWLTIALHLANC
jgi:hypothetical protein